MINLLNTIWFVRNEAGFNNKLIPWRTAISLIIANTSLSGTFTNKASNNSMREFTILKSFNVTIHHPMAPTITEVIWKPPLLHWVKCNTDGASLGNPGQASCGGAFKPLF